MARSDEPLFDVVIIGAGLMGAAAAWSLAERGRSVCVLEQFEPGHVNGSSHGTARIVRRAYSDALYVELTGRAFELWAKVEREASAAVIRVTGGLDFGDQRDVASIAAHLDAAGVPYELLHADEAAARWPGMLFEGDVLYHAQAGTLDADAAIRAMLTVAEARGAELRTRSRAMTITPSSERAQIVCDDGTRLDARCAVVAAGPWVAELLDGIVQLPPMHVTQQQVFHFPRLERDRPPWPTAIHDGGGVPVYHLSGGGQHDDRKIGEHITRGVPTTASTRSFAVDPDARQRVIDYVHRWLPGLSPEPRDETTCLYTTTPSEDFLVDRVGPLVVCSPCSGHGAKFAPLIGELVAGLVLGDDGPPTRFSLAAHLAGQAGAVSL